MKGFQLRAFFSKRNPRDGSRCGLESACQHGNTACAAFASEAQFLRVRRGNTPGKTATDFTIAEDAGPGTNDEALVRLEGKYEKQSSVSLRVHLSGTVPSCSPPGAKLAGSLDPENRKPRGGAPSE